jgi:hypothetical protein
VIHKDGTAIKVALRVNQIAVDGQFYFVGLLFVMDKSRRRSAEVSTNVCAEGATRSASEKRCRDEHEQKGARRTTPGWGSYTYEPIRRGGFELGPKTESGSGELTTKAFRAERSPASCVCMALAGRGSKATVPQDRVIDRRGGG